MQTLGMYFPKRGRFRIIYSIQASGKTPGGPKRANGMPMIKTNGIIIKQTKCGDYDKFLTVLSEDLGKITVIAKGVRSMKNKNAPACQMLMFDEFVLKKNPSDIYSLSQAEIKESFYGLRENVFSLALAVYLAELASYISQEGADMGGLLRLLLNTLYFLAKDAKRAKNLRCLFELRFLDLAGFAPLLNVCAGCGKQGELAFFDAAAGGLCCVRCARGKSISREAVLAMQSLLFSTLSQAFSYRADDRVWDEVCQHLEKFINMHVEEQIKSLKYLKSLEKPLQI